VNDGNVASEKGDGVLRIVSTTRPAFIGMRLADALVEILHGQQNST